MRADFYIDTDYRVVHEDEAIIVIDKPAPLAVNPVGSYVDLNLQSLLKKDPRRVDTPVKLVHRLDSETSGVIVFAKSDEAASHIGRQFMEGAVEKTYEAVVFGCPADPKGDIHFPLGNDASSGFQTVRIHDPRNGEKAHTRYEVLCSSADHAHVRLTPLTGRTHQLRVHLALLGHPIVGDKIYVDLDLFARYVSGGLDAGMLERLKLPRLALHASSISFMHPASGAPVRFSAPLPPLIHDFLVSQGLK